MRPPSLPDESFDRGNVDLWKIEDWKKSYAVSVLAGLSTEPSFHANAVRFDWLQRLVLSKSNGRRKPQPKELSLALNAGLDRAGVLRLEDPVEDVFCDLIATPHGNYRIFTGIWEAAAPYTQTLLDAFEYLPPGSLKRDALTSIYSLLKLSDELAKRANVHRSTPQIPWADGSRSPRPQKARQNAQTYPAGSVSATTARRANWASAARCTP